MILVSEAIKQCTKSFLFCLALPRVVSNFDNKCVLLSWVTFIPSLWVQMNINVMASSRDVVFKSTNQSHVLCTHEGMDIPAFRCFNVSGHRHGHEALKGMVGGIT